MTLDEIKIGGLGRQRRRVEDNRFIRGTGNYVDDVVLPGMLLHGDPAQPARSREDHLDRHQRGVRDPRCPHGDDRRDDGRSQPRLDADAVL